MHKNDQDGILKSLDRYLIRRRQISHVQNVYHTYLVTGIVIVAFEFALPLLPLKSIVALMLMGSLLLVAGGYSFIRLYKLARTLRYEAISLYEAESRMITDYGVYFDLNEPEHFMRYFEIAEKLDSRPALPEQGILLILFSAFVVGAGFWVLVVAGVLAI